MSDSLSALELAKRSVNPYASEGVFERVAAGGLEVITPADDIIMRWHGLYQQRPKEAGLFMVRLKLPHGAITAEQAMTVARMAEELSTGRIDISTRQNLQVHSIPLAALPRVFASLNAAGLTTLGACGDAVRTIVGCPASGIAAEEVRDTLPLAQSLTHFFLRDLHYANLPRKLKIALCGCAQHCVPTEINDVGLVAAPQADEPGFVLSVGGGLAARPVLGVPLAWVSEEDTTQVVAALAAIHRDHGNRQNRAKARMKHLLALWGTERLREELERRVGRPLAPVPQGWSPPGDGRDHLGVHPQNEPGRSFIGVPILAAQLSSAQLAGLARLAAEHGRGRLRFTHFQNVLVPDIPLDRVGAVLERLGEMGLPVDAHSWSGHTTVCPGREFCNKAVTHTRPVLLSLVETLARQVLHAPVRLGMSGCPNGCAHHHLADIGFQGSATTVEGTSQERYDVWAGGDLSGPQPAFARRILQRMPPDALPEVVLGLLKRYQEEADDGEGFAAFARRVLWNAEA
ncbi:MAG: nitrite/sulfite reductase [Armatimonadota bacterium]|nr:nitrite/sulfite reductase [Armatimonadota bacterium]